MLKLVISCWYDGVVVACRYMFAMGPDVVHAQTRYSSRRTNTTSEPITNT